MTRNEILLIQLAEECSEVAQRVSKALRFGLDEVQPGQPFNNAERIIQEYCDLKGVYLALQLAGVFPVDQFKENDMVFAKLDKIEKYMDFTAARGIIDGIPADPECKHPEAK